MTPIEAAAHRQLRAAGLRVTAPRLAVLDTLDAMPHATADQVAARVRERIGTVSIQTVYDTLRICADNGLIRRIEPAGSSVRYETRTADNHHHLVCRSCGAVRDVDCVVGAAPCLTPDDHHGFLVDEAEVIFWGLCPECQQASSEKSAHPDQEHICEEFLSRTADAVT